LPAAIMKISLEKKLIGIFIFVVATILFLGREIFMNNKKYHETAFWVQHTQQVLYELETILSINKDAETAIRGYALSGSKEFLWPFLDSKEKVFKHINQVRELTKDNPAQHKLIDSLAFLTKQKMDFSLSAVTGYDTKGFEEARNLIASGRGLDYMNDIRKIADQMKAEENRLLKIRKEANVASNQEFTRTYVSQLVIIITILFIAFLFIYYGFRSRKKAQQQLLESQELLQSIIDNTSSIIYIKDTEGKFLLVNKQFERRSGKSKEEILGKTSEEIFPKSIADSGNEEDKQVLQANSLQEFEEDVNFNGANYNLFTIKFPLFKKNQPYAVCGITTDITEVKKQANLIKDLYDNAPCGYYSLDNDGKFLNANNTTANWLGYSREELMGRCITTMLTPASLEIFKDNFPAFKAKGSITEQEYEYIRKDGSVMPVLLNASVVKDANGNYLYSRSNIFDITERKKLEEELKVINKELESFTYSVSHDLRAPLRIIGGYSEIITHDNATKLSSDSQRMLGNIVRNANRMGQLIDDLLNFSRLGRKELIRHNTDVNAIVKTIVDEQLRNMPSKHYQVEIDDLGTCNCDSNLFKQVWENLISNALKYSRNKENPVIKIGMENKLNEKIYFVQDNGAGFDMKYYHKLFGVFQRLHNIKEFEGTGVGLALVQRIVYKHGGRVWAESKLNEGTTFYFSIPNPDLKTIKI
jgi:PAS domain S-box-containing protein